MKRLNSLLLVGLLLVGTFTFTNCSKSGCTDPDSVNYDPDAKKDDGSCAYEGKNVFWYGQATADSLASLGVSSLVFYIDKDIAGSTSASVYWTKAQDCGSEGSITVTKNLGDSKSKSYPYRVIDAGTDAELWKGTVEFKANTCTAVELIF